MRIRPPDSPTSPLLWFSVLGAPAAWAGQFAISYWVTQARCSVPGGRWGISVDAWAIGLTVVAVAAAAGGWLVALALFRATGDDDFESAPPGGRTRFMAAVGLAIAPIFLAIILLNGIGAVVQDCGQS
jgi:hypothetical protein